MSEKFDFSKIEDQKKFEKLSEKERENIIGETNEEAEKIKEMVDQQKVTDYASAAKQIEARKNWQRGHLGVTAEDHRAFGGTPDLELSQNQGKTLGELWNIEKIREKLEESIAFLKKARKNYEKKHEGDPRYPDNRWYRDDILNEKDELRKTILFLKSIGKLPKEFENFEVEDLESDPR